jgi:hypothetical protein
VIERARLLEEVELELAGHVPDVDEDLLEELAPRNGIAFGPTAGDILGLVREQEGVTHAAYPDAPRTLCSRPVVELEPVGRDPRPPACEPCERTARRFDRIDSSAPAGWFRAR